MLHKYISKYLLRVVLTFVFLWFLEEFSVDSCGVKMNHYSNLVH